MDCFFKPLSNCRLEDVVDPAAATVFLTAESYNLPNTKVCEETTFLLS